MLRPRNSVWAGLICLAVALPVIADETASSQSPQPGTREFIKAEGRRLVRARQWQQASDDTARALNKAQRTTGGTDGQ